MSNLTATFTVDATPQDVYDAINDVRSWWSGNIVGPTTSVGDTWYYLVPEIHYSKQLVTTLVPGGQVVWEFTDGHLDFIDDKGEWIGTTARFDISREGGLTRLTFTHEGLSTAEACYDVCYDAWTHYITVSLKGRIETGRGQIRTHAEDEAAVAAR